MPKYDNGGRFDLKAKYTDEARSYHACRRHTLRLGLSLARDPGLATAGVRGRVRGRDGQALQLHEAEEGGQRRGGAREEGREEVRDGASPRTSLRAERLAVPRTGSVVSQPMRLSSFPLFRFSSLSLGLGCSRTLVSA